MFLCNKDIPAQHCPAHIQHHPTWPKRHPACQLPLPTAANVAAPQPPQHASVACLRPRYHDNYNSGLLLTTCCNKNQIYIIISFWTSRHCHGFIVSLSSWNQETLPSKRALLLFIIWRSSSLVFKVSSSTEHQRKHEKKYQLVKIHPMPMCQLFASKSMVKK